MRHFDAMRMTVVLSVLVLLLAGIALARAAVTWFTSTTTTLGYDVSKVEVTCSPGYELAPGNLVCPPGSRTKIRGLGVFSHEDSTDPLVTGSTTWVFNANLDVNGNGPCWGTTKTQLDNNLGTWDGTYNCEFGTMSGGQHSLKLNEMVGHGTSGEVEGMLLKMSGVQTGLNGYYLDPHGGK